MKYKNTKTGAVIDSPCKISGGDWIEEKKEVEKTTETTETTETAETEETTEETDEGINGVTKKQIMQELEAMGIKHDPKARKEELYKLMFGGR